MVLDHFISSIHHGSNSHAQSHISKAAVINAIVRPFFLLVRTSSSMAFGDISTCFIRARVFGEVKPCNVDNRSAAIDLVRLCVFGKDNIDVHKADKILLFHVIGCKVTFYVETLYDEGLYVVAELCTVTLPSSLKEFAALTENVDNLLDVYLTMKTVSCNLDQCKWEANRRDTLDTPSFRAAMSKSKHHQTCLVLM
ncbi:hypothetical protein O0I10_001499 [Lichtheimia ornata]|uniref:Uncharacterized protein n=1 Tax=Lichtheimia ornata TaxID=688661 RepID=A0AAD7VAQ6_9FUNG|nr:uncharacterized protein O0I10_001499 [Lichtheimia ornata]KAJ8662538.1 hypothetical protein O0I10_001499 [Lichtheimia ornata]